MLLDCNVVVALLLSLFASCVYGNTEIVNFRIRKDYFPELPSGVEVSSSWPTLSALPENANQASFLVNLSLPCAVLYDQRSIAPGGSEDFWLRLDLPSFQESSNSFLFLPKDRYTLRISWPAMMPSKFDIQLFQPLQGHHRTFPDHHLPNGILTIYALIRISNTGVRQPANCNLDRGPLYTSTQFDIVLEPLVLGIIPRSLIGTLGFLMLLIPVAWAVGNLIHVYLTNIASSAGKSHAKKMAKGGASASSRRKNQ